MNQSIFLKDTDAPAKTLLQEDNLDFGGGVVNNSIQQESISLLLIMFRETGEKCISQLQEFRSDALIVANRKMFAKTTGFPLYPPPQGRNLINQSQEIE